MFLKFTNSKVSRNKSLLSFWMKKKHSDVGRNVHSFNHRMRWCVSRSVEPFLDDISPEWKKQEVPSDGHTFASTPSTLDVTRHVPKGNRRNGLHTPTRRIESLTVYPADWLSLIKTTAGPDNTPGFEKCLCTCYPVREKRIGPIYSTEHSKIAFFSKLLKIAGHE